jgi:hypothetical protein
MYPRELQAENCVIVVSFSYSHRDMQGKRIMEFLSHLSGYHMTAIWKAISTRPEEGRSSDCGMWKPTRRTRSKSPDSWNPCTTKIRESYFLWDKIYVPYSM